MLMWDWSAGQGLVGQGLAGEVRRRVAEKTFVATAAGSLSPIGISGVSILALGGTVPWVAGRRDLRWTRERGARACGENPQR